MKLKLFLRVLSKDEDMEKSLDLLKRFQKLKYDYSFDSQGNPLVSVKYAMCGYLDPGIYPIVDSKGNLTEYATVAEIKRSEKNPGEPAVVYLEASTVDHGSIKMISYSDGEKISCSKMIVPGDIVETMKRLNILQMALLEEYDSEKEENNNS